MTPRPRRAAIAGLLAALALLAACSPAPSGSASPRPPATPGTSPGQTIVRAYFLLGSLTGDGGLVPVLRSVPGSEAIRAAALDALLAGPNEAELSATPAMFTAIPEGTEALELSLGADGTALVKLPNAFFDAGAGPAQAQRYAQVVYTLTQFPEVRAVRFEAADERNPGASPARTRDDYRDLLPALWIDDPAWGGALPSGGHVSGLANAFEAQFTLMLLDAGGRALVDMPVTASCGTGCWGTFDVAVDYAVTEAQWGTVRAFEPSAANGSPTHVLDYPVWLTP